MNSQHRPPSRKRVCLNVFFFVGCWATCAGSTQAAPQITNLSLRGLQTGTVTTLTIDGADLLPAPHVVLPIAISAQTVKEGATAARVEIAVTLPASTAPGMYNLRIANSKGISNAVLVGIDDLEQVPFALQASKLPVALHGTLSDSATLETSFAGKKGQRVVVEVEARRLGAAFDPVVELYDPRHVQLAWSQGQARLAGDARLEATLPNDGTYSVALHDMLYRAGHPNQFRLKIGDLSYADLVFPLGGRRGTEQMFEVIGHMPQAVQKLRVDLRGTVGDLPAPLPQVHGLTGPAPRIMVSELPEVLEAAPPAGKLQEVSVPAAINGRISRPGEEARYRLPVKPGMHLRFDVRANRSGSPLDGVLTLRNESGAQLAESDDRPDTVDPGLDFTVPADVHAVVVALKDLEGRGGPNFVYRLLVTAADRPDFGLMLFDAEHALPRSGTAIVRIRANRTAYNGAIKLTLPGLPSGVILSGNEIPAGASDALVSLTAPAAADLAHAVARIIGESSDPKSALRRTAMRSPTPMTRNQPWLRSELAVAVTDAGPIAVAWDSGEPSLALGSTYPARIRVTRTAGAKGALRLSLLTSQVVPKTPDGKEDGNRALRLEGTPMIAADQVGGVVPVIVPGDLPALPYDLAIRADLLGADGKMVLATTVTPSRRFQAGQPFTLQLANASVEARSGSGPTGKLIGKVARLGGFNRPVTVSLTGLPPELPAPSVMVPGDRNDFELAVSFPYETKLGLLPNVRLTATSQISAQQIARANEIPVAVQVVKGDPPPPPPPLYRVFEDEPVFLAMLNEGDGQMALEAVDRYAGSAALRVSGGQRFRTRMPGWGYKIVEKPGNGEFRYLRFAWKKRGGDNILLQLNANGGWGPQRGAPGPSYRYEAGPGDNPFHAAAVRVDARLPDDWVVVSRDLYADFGAFALTGIAFTPGPGDYALFDHVYLARSLDDFKSCPQPLPPEQPRVIFEDEQSFVADLIEGAGTAVLEPQDKYSGVASIKVTPDQRFNERLYGNGIPIRQNPGRGEYRFLRFAWKKRGGESICLQLNHDGQWGPTDGKPAKYRYHAGPGPECYGASMALDNKIPTDWVVITRDLYADFGEFNWTGIALSPVDGEYALFDHLYLGRTTRDFVLVQPKPPAKPK